MTLWSKVGIQLELEEEEQAFTGLYSSWIVRLF